MTFKSKNIEDLKHFIQHDLNLLLKWFSSSKLGLNIKKTNFMVFSLSGNIPNLDIEINNQKLKQVLTTKFLGLMIDYDLKWTSQIQQIKSKIAPYIFALAKSKKNFT